MSVQTYVAPAAQIGLLVLEMQEAGLPALRGSGPDGTGTVTVLFERDLTAAEVSAAVAVVAAHPAPKNPRVRAAANLLLADLSPAALALRGLALVTLDEINLLRDWVAQFKAAVAAASSLADLKARVAALPNTPQRTGNQIKTALASKNASGEAD